MGKKVEVGSRIVVKLVNTSKNIKCRRVDLDLAFFIIGKEFITWAFVDIIRNEQQRSNVELSSGSPRGFCLCVFGTQEVRDFNRKKEI